MVVRSRPVQAARATELQTVRQIRDHMRRADETTEISQHLRGAGIQVRTPGRYAMDVAVAVLELFDSQSGVSVEHTGWQRGFGLEVAAWIPIRARNVVAELQTDGDQFDIRLVSGPVDEFELLLDAVREFLS